MGQGRESNSLQPSPRKTLCGAWNFGPRLEAHRTVSEVAEFFQIHFPTLKIKYATAKPHLHEANLLKLNIEKAMSRLGWKPRLSLDETLSWTALWYKAYLSKAPHLRELTLSQIQEYENR